MFTPNTSTKDPTDLNSNNDAWHGVTDELKQLTVGMINLTIALFKNIVRNWLLLEAVENIHNN